MPARRTVAYVTAIAITLLIFGHPLVHAQDVEQVPVVSLRETAAVLARAGAANNDARTVLAAAQIMITAERATANLRRVDPRPTNDARPGEARKGGDLTAASLLRLAVQIAVDQSDAQTAYVAARLARDAEIGLGNEALGEELGRAAAALTSTRGASGGPVWADGLLGAVPRRIDSAVGAGGLCLRFHLSRRA